MTRRQSRQRRRREAYEEGPSRRSSDVRAETRDEKTHDALYIPDSLLARTRRSPCVTRVPHYIHDGPPGTLALLARDADSETGNRAIHTQKSRHVRKILTPH